MGSLRMCPNCGYKAGTGPGWYFWVYKCKQCSGFFCYECDGSSGASKCPHCWSKEFSEETKATMS